MSRLEARPRWRSSHCQLTGARITTTTTGLDFDPFDGYRLDVDGTDRGILPTAGTVLTRLDPGSRTIALGGLAPNCAIDGPDSHTVTIVDTEITPVEFVVVCTATSGVIRVVVEASGTDVNSSYEAVVDGARSVFVRPSGPAYLTAVSGGDHVVSLVAPGNCSVEGDPHSVVVTVGGLIRDTVEVAFSVTCVPGVTERCGSPLLPPDPYRPRPIAFGSADRTAWATARFLGWLQPNGTLGSDPEPGRYGLILRDVPARCSVRSNPSSFSFTVTDSATTDIEFRVRCPP